MGVQVKLKRFTKIRNYRVFRDYSWPATLPAFSRFNLIYGWNGSGKTTLSSIFRAIQRGSPIIDGEIELDFDGSSILCSDLTSSGLPGVRVFDRHFVNVNIFETGGQFSPIYVLGEDSIEKQRKVEELRAHLRLLTDDILKKESDKRAAEARLDEFCIAQGTLVRELLNTAGKGTYNSYDKGRFRRRAESLTSETARAAILDERSRNADKALITTRPKDQLQKLAITSPNIKELTDRAESLLVQSVVSSILQDLAKDTDVATWAQKGLALHTGDKSSKICRFCGQTLPSGRLEAIERHFNDDFKRLQREVQDLIDVVNSAADRLSGQTFHDGARLYENLVDEYKAALRSLTAIVDLYTKYLDGLAEALLMKRENPLVRVQLQTYINTVESVANTNLDAAVNDLNKIIERHNLQTDNFGKDLEAARVRLELSIVGEAFEKFDELRKMLASENGLLEAFRLEEVRLKGEIEAIERDIVEHRRPVAELNSELEAYLGRSEIKLEFRDTGYAITRSGHPASDLSEGEKTAIGFLYFLKSLKDKSFNISEGIVVIDDPVSSLDANSLFCAFGYMRDRTKDAAQLFILTHNFGFFRQVRSWFRHLPGQGKKNVALRPAQFYLLNAFFKGGERNAAIQPLDPLLHDYESEYHYLFKSVADESVKDGTDTDLEQYYGMPNVARRLLEAFLAFRQPALCGELQEQLALVPYDDAKKARMIRFLHTFSHKDHIAEGDHDLQILSETRPVLLDVLDLISKVDPEHHAAMTTLISPPDDLASGAEA